MTTVPIPPEFAALGFTGRFQASAMASPAAIDVWEPRAPCLIPGDHSWMVLTVDRTAETITLVRRDASAIWDIATHCAPGGRDA